MARVFKFLLALQLLLARLASIKWILLATRNFHSPLASGCFPHWRIHVKYFIPDVSPPLASAIRQYTQIGSYSCTWTMHAASTVIGKPIKSVYPVVNGPADMNIKILNTTFKPRGSRSRHDITIMWSGGNTIGSFWKPCHFVPLIPHTVEYSTINIDDYEQVMSMALFKSKT